MVYNLLCHTLSSTKLQYPPPMRSLQALVLDKLKANGSVLRKTSFASVI